LTSADKPLTGTVTGSSPHRQETARAAGAGVIGHWQSARPRRGFATRKSAPALGGTIIGGINASGFLFASHAFEISRIGGIRLLRTQSASCVVHCIMPVRVAPISHQRLEPALTLEDSLLTWDDDLLDRCEGWLRAQWALIIRRRRQKIDRQRQMLGD